MFWPDVIALKEFYAGALGKAASNAVNRKLQKMWPNFKGESILGLGFATPYLSYFLEEPSQNIFACMPAAQGVVPWPPGSANLSLLADESELPFPDNSINRVVLSHALENSEQMRRMMSEVWRVLSPAGRVVAVVPNRRGIWARSPHSPFAHGQPYTTWQLRRLFSEHSFTPLYSAAALFFPPSNRRYLLNAAKFLEACGAYFFPGFGGVLIIEAEKQIYAPLMQKVRSKGKRSYVGLTQPAGI